MAVLLSWLLALFIAVAPATAKTASREKFSDTLDYSSQIASQLVEASEETCFYEYDFASGDSLIFYVWADHLDTPRAITKSDASNAVVWKWESDPFGATPAQESGLAYNVRFPGQYFDAETQTHYNYFRDYNPQTGRYQQSDPIGLTTDSKNTYTYVGASSLLFVDELGLCHKRPSGFRKGVRDKVWKKAIEPGTNRVRDSGTGQFMLGDKPWDMGHRPGKEYWRFEKYANDTCMARKEFLDEYNNPKNYRPEAPSSNRSHKYEDCSDRAYSYKKRKK